MSTFTLPERCRCGCLLVGEFYSINRERVALLCGNCLTVRAIAVKPKAHSGDREVAV